MSKGELEVGVQGGIEVGVQGGIEVGVQGGIEVGVQGGTNRSAIRRSSAVIAHLSLILVFHIY